MTSVRPRRRRQVRERAPSPPPVILVDTNVLLDAVLVRMRWAADAVSLLAAAVRGDVEVVASVHALATLDYVARKRIGAAASQSAIVELMTMISVAEVGSDDVRYALSSAIPDFEDALHVAAARRAGAQVIATRDPADYRNSPIPALGPAAALATVMAR
jgi:Predicted nucleic acid-binding protein, contains PIN domain